MASAAPPTDPVISVKNIGEIVTIRWYAENATGYRLAYAPYPKAEPVQLIDMGNANEFSTALPLDSAYYVAVQAYNSEGESVFSDVEYFILDQYAVMDASSVDPAQLPLRLEKVQPNSPVIFLPTEEAAIVQADSLQAAETASTEAARLLAVQKPELSPTADGKIGLAIEIAPSIIPRDLVLNFCLEIGDICHNLLVWSDANKGYGDTTTITDLPTDIQTNIYTDLLIPPTLVSVLRDLVQSPQTFTVRTTVVNSKNTQNIAVYTTHLPIVAVTGESTDMTRAAGQARFDFGGVDFGGDRFAVGFKTGLELRPFVFQGLEYTSKDGAPISDGVVKSQFGVRAGPELTLNAKLFGYSFVLLEGGLKILKNTGKNLSGRVELKLFGIDFTAIGDAIGAAEKDKVIDALKILGVLSDESYEKLKSFPFGTICRVEDAQGQSAFKPLNSLTDDQKKTCSSVPEFVSAADKIADNPNKLAKLELTPPTLFDLPIAVMVKQEKTFLLWVIPLKIKGSVTGAVGIQGGGRFENIGEWALTISATPYVKLVGKVSLAVTILVAEAGVEGSLTLIENNLVLLMRILLSTEMKFAGIIRNDLKGPNGKVEIYATWLQPVFGIPPWKRKEARETIVKFSTFQRQDSLATWGGYKETCKDFFCTPQWPSWDTASKPSDNTATNNLNGNNVSASEGVLLEKLSSRPTDTEEGWICLYSDANYQGNEACLKAPTGEDKNLVVNDISLLDKTFNDVVSSIRIGPKTAIGIYEHNNLKGSSHYWYSNTLHGIDNLTSYNFNDSMSSFIVMNLSDHASRASNTEKKACIYRDADYQGGEKCYTPDGSNVSKIAIHDEDWKDKASSVKVFGKGVVLCLIDTGAVETRSCFFGVPAGSLVPNLHTFPEGNTIADKADGLEIYWSADVALSEHFAVDKARINLASSHGKVFIADANKTGEQTGGLEIMTNILLVGPLKEVKLRTNDGKTLNYHLNGDTWDNIFIGEEFNDRIVGVTITK
ncbi:peptidase inhibitor family I36 protein [Beggiatoa alba]|uniref:peptidase inhibitor family I36 protein n=1 Tax=Beggiatoa alba TaxID=1022 RepID=UPI0012F859D1|nr:peptidase inhibitor family I36 protein [Beggiatoa alba]